MPRLSRMIKSWITGLLTLLLRIPHARAWGQRALARLPGVRARVIRLIHGGNPSQIAPPNAVDGRGERQQHLCDALERRWEESE